MTRNIVNILPLSLISPPTLEMYQYTSAMVSPKKERFHTLTKCWIWYHLICGTIWPQIVKYVSTIQFVFSNKQTYNLNRQMIWEWRQLVNRFLCVLIVQKETYYTQQIRSWPKLKLGALISSTTKLSISLTVKGQHLKVTNSLYLIGQRWLWVLGTFIIISS